MPPWIPVPGLCPWSGGRAGVPAPERIAGGRGGQGGSSRTKRTASRTWIELKSLAAPHSDPASHPAGLLAGGRRVSGAPGSSGPLHPARVRRGEGGAPGPPLSGALNPGRGLGRGVPWGILAGILPSPTLGTPGRARAAPRFLCRKPSRVLPGAPPFPGQPGPWGLLPIRGWVTSWPSLWTYLVPRSGALSLLGSSEPTTFQDRLFYSHFRKKLRPREGQQPAVGHPAGKRWG